MRTIARAELYETIKKYKDKHVAVTFHTIGDRDAIGSAFALSYYLNNAIVVTPDFITNNARRMLEFLNLTDKIKTALPEGLEAMVVVDANNLYALGKFQNAAMKITDTLFIDHHVLQGQLPQNSLVFNDESYNSTASIVYEALKGVGAEVNREMAILLLNGIVADSADLQNSTPQTFQQIAELLEISKLSFSFFSEYFRAAIPAKNKYDVIKEIASAKVEMVGKYIIIYGRASEHANIAADAALKLDADAAVFWVSGKTEASVSARLRPPLEKELPLHLGILMKDIGMIVGGNGGGHAGAAGAYGPKKWSAQAAGEEVVRRIKARMLEKP